MTFRCGYCERTLPDFMQQSTRACTDCSEEGDTQEAKQERGQELGIGSSGRSSTRNVITTSDPLPLPKATTNTSPRTTTDTSETTNAERESHQVRVSEHRERQLYWRPDIPDKHSHLSMAHVFALGEYKSDSYHQDGFTSRVLNLKEGGRSHEPFFAEQFDSFLDRRLGELSFDEVTTYPGHRGGTHEALVSLVDTVAAGRSFRHNPRLERTEDSQPQKSLSTYLGRWDNQVGTIDINGDVSGKTVLLVDDVSTTGASLTVGTHELLIEGANRVISLCLALSKSRQQMMRELSDERHTIMSLVNNET